MTPCLWLWGSGASEPPHCAAGRPGSFTIVLRADSASRSRSGGHRLESPIGTTPSQPVDRPLASSASTRRSLRQLERTEAKRRSAPGTSPVRHRSPATRGTTDERHVRQSVPRRRGLKRRGVSACELTDGSIQFEPVGGVQPRMRWRLRDGRRDSRHSLAQIPQSV